MVKKVLALMLAMLMLMSVAVSAATEVIVCITDEKSANNPGFEETSGTWGGSTNSTLNIHYVNPETGKSLARYMHGGAGDAVVTANLPEAGKYHVYYFVSGHMGAGGNDTSELTVSVNHKGGKTDVKLNLSDASKKGFQDLGEFDFDAGEVKVNLSTPENKGFLRFSAMKFENKSGNAGTIIGGTASSTPTATKAPATTAPTTPAEKVEGTEAITCVVSSAGGDANVGINEIEGQWFGSDNAELNIHYVNPQNGKTAARVLTGDGSMEVSTKIPEAGKYEVYYFVSGHTTDADKMAAEITHKGGADKVEFSLKDSSKKGFQKLGEFDFDEGTALTKLSVKGATGFLRFSAIKYVNKAGTKGQIINATASQTGSVATPAPIGTPKPIVTPTPSANPFKDKFTDLKGHWAKDTIEAMANAGIVKGTSETTYEPEGNVTRAEFTALMVRAMGYEEVEYDGQFEDVAADAWYAKNVASMAKTGIIVGYDGKFNPDDNITHEEAVKICVAAYEYKLGPMDPGALATIFDDYFEISDWARPYINKGVMISVAQGFENKLQFKPLQKTTRAEAAVMINNLKNAVKVSENFNDIK